MRLKAVPFTAVKIEDRFWKPRQETNRRETVWHCLKMLEESGALDNLRFAALSLQSSAALPGQGFRGFVFADSDVYKVLEGASFLLAAVPDPKLEAELDRIIQIVADAQWPDGYLNSAYTINKPDKRFTNLRDDHELYCAGHLIEAAVAHFEALGKRNLLDVAIRFADLLCDRFGPEGTEGYGGHPELELALVKLWKATGNRRYFELVTKQLRERGSHYYAKEHGIPDAEYDGSYNQDDVPIDRHRQIKGHAVRAAYLMSGVADVVLETGEAAWVEMLDQVWLNTTQKRVYVTGGIGTSAKNEGFTEDYDLPNESAYQETCASIALAMWGSRMNLLDQDSRYFDAVENALYNATLAGVSLDGTHFFYVNPLESDGSHLRQPWFECACCPPNILRTIAAVGGCAYACSNDSLYVNLYLPGTAEIEVGAAKVGLRVEGDYPWDGGIRLTIRLDAPKEFALALRVPGWVEPGQFKTSIVPDQIENGYAIFKRLWKDNDTLEITMPMPIQRLSAHPLVRADTGRVALRRGPLIYCAEQASLGCAPAEIRVGNSNSWQTRWERSLDGHISLVGSAERERASEWDGQLYQKAPPRETVRAQLIPYCLWANLEPGPMLVWLRE